ncbi:MAG: hypothetical protein R3A10_18000 [Caldilineaceae bacterium]
MTRLIQRYFDRTLITMTRRRDDCDPELRAAHAQVARRAGPAPGNALCHADT